MDPMYGLMSFGRELLGASEENVTLSFGVAHAGDFVPPVEIGPLVGGTLKAYFGEAVSERPVQYMPVALEIDLRAWLAGPPEMEITLIRTTPMLVSEERRSQSPAVRKATVFHGIEPLRTWLEGRWVTR